MNLQTDLLSVVIPPGVGGGGGVLPLYCVPDVVLRLGSYIVLFNT